jgi:hypothetical protein
LQISFAFALSFIYCIVQILVLIGLIVPMAMSNPLYCNSNAVFFLLVALTFILCGLLHPQEIMSLVHGFAYYMAIPTMYLILMIYAVCNLHVISWGTRETKKEGTEANRSVMKRLRNACSTMRSGICEKTPGNSGRSCCKGCDRSCCYPTVQVIVDMQGIRTFNGVGETAGAVNGGVVINDNIKEGRLKYR